MKKSQCQYCGWSPDNLTVPDDAQEISCFECCTKPDRWKVVLRCVELASARGRFCSVAGQYLESYDLEAHDGGGSAIFTDDLNKAMKFDDIRMAIKALYSSPKARPLRGDGLPNRPLTAFTMELLIVDRAMRQIVQ